MKDLFGHPTDAMDQLLFGGSSEQTSFRQTVWCAKASAVPIPPESGSAKETAAPQVQNMVKSGARDTSQSKS